MTNVAKPESLRLRKVAPIATTLNQQAMNELMNKMGEILTVAEVAILLRLHPTTIYRLVKRGELPGFKIGDNWRISSDALESWILQQRPDHLSVSKIGR